MKKVLSVLLVIAVMVSFGTFSSYASSATLVMDNDALASSGTTNPSYDGAHSFGGYSMYSYITASYYYNGDARRGLSNGYNATLGVYGACYAWSHAFPSTVGRASLDVYLKEATFNDPAASYDGWTGYVGNIHFGTIDQNVAPSGWSYVGTQDISGHSTMPVYVSSSLTSGKYLGADAVRVTYTY